MTKPVIANVIREPGTVEISDSGLPTADASLKYLVRFVISLYIPMVSVRLWLEVVPVFHGKEASQRH
jgi:hypothetical protein